MIKNGLDPADAANIPQPTYVDLWGAFEAGAREARRNPNASDFIISRAADAYCKLWHLEKDPEGFKLFHQLKNEGKD